MSLTEDSVLEKRDVDGVEAKPSTFRVRKPAAGFGSPAHASYTELYGEEFDPYYASLFRGKLDVSNREFFPDFFKSYRNNTYTSFACDYLAGQILDYGWHVEGDGAKKVEKFFAKDKTYDKINYTEGAFGGAATYGLGMLDLSTRDGKLVATRPLNPLRIGGLYDPMKGRVRYFYSDDSMYQGRRVTTDKELYLREENIFVNTLNYDPYDPFPTAPLRSTLLLFTILYDMNGDIAEAVKRIAYAPFIIYANTDGVEEDMKDAFVRELAELVDASLSASTNLCIDDKHKAGTSGTVGGGGGAQMLPVDKLMVPIMSIALAKHGIPLGLLIQDGANKSILEKQMEATQKHVLGYKERFAENVTGLLERITDKDVSFQWNSPTPSNTEMANLRKHYLELIAGGIVDAEYVRNKLNINVLSGSKKFQAEGVL